MRTENWDRPKIVVEVDSLNFSRSSGLSRNIACRFIVAFGMRSRFFGRNPESFVKMQRKYVVVKPQDCIAIEAFNCPGFYRNYSSNEQPSEQLQPWLQLKSQKSHKKVGNSLDKRFQKFEHFNLNSNLIEKSLQINPSWSN